MTAPAARRREQLELAASLRARNQPATAIAATLRDRYGVNGRVGMRLAHGWRQADAAAAWNERWPDDAKTFKSFSYWENWPSPTGHAPSLAVLDRLAQLYRCDVADLLAGWGAHRPGPDATSTETDFDTVAWQVGHLDLHELTRALADWSLRLPAAQRQALLLKLSTAAAVAAASGTSSGPRRSRGTPTVPDLAGAWISTYRYRSTSRDAEFEGVHRVALRIDRGQLIGRSLAHPSGSELELALSVDGSLVTGSWTERTSPKGHYRAATYHGVVQLVLDPTYRSMTGRWLGVSKRFTIKSGDWRLEWDG